MTALLDDWLQFKRKVSSLAERAQQAKGALKQSLATIKKEFGVDTLEEAEELLGEMRKKELRLTRRYLKLRRRFEKKWAKSLTGIASD